MVHKSLIRAGLASAYIRVASLGALTLAMTALPSVAFAQEDQIQSLLDSAIEDYDLVMVEDAEAKLLEAVEIAKTKGISGPTVAKVYVMLGIVRFANNRDAAETKRSFISAVEADASAEIDSVYQTPELNEIMDEARAEAKPSSSNNGGDNGGGDASSFKHPAITTADAGQPLTIEAFVPESMPVFRMVVHHRRFGEEAYVSTEMKPTSTTRFAGAIPSNKVTSSQLEYYIEALDRGGNVLASQGTDSDPLVAVILGSDGSGGDGNNGNGGDGNGGDGNGGDGNNTELPDGEDQETKNVYVTLGGGSDVGFLPGGTPTANPVGREVQPGIAPAFGHGLLDLGWIINTTMRLGLYFRWQFSPAQDFALVPEESKGGSFPQTKDECFGFGLPGDCLLGLKYKYFFSKGGASSVRFYSSVGLGVGRVRNWLRLREVAKLSDGSNNPNCEGKSTLIDPAQGTEYCYIRDTVRTGWGHFGLGAGVAVPLGKFVEFNADTYLMFLTLDQTSINLDGTVGFTFKF